MNEHGLVANLLYLSEADFGPAPSDNRPRLSFAGWVQYVLTSFSTVNEVVDAFSNPSIYIVPIDFGPNKIGHPTVHLAVSDALTHAFWYDPKLPESIEANHMMADFFVKQLGK